MADCGTSYPGFDPIPGYFGATGARTRPRFENPARELLHRMFRMEVVIMFYSGLALLGFAVVVLALGLVGLTPGAGGLVNVALLTSALLLAAGALTLGHHHYLRIHRRQLRH